MTGVLPVALEEAVKVLRALLLSGKEYVCVMRLHQQEPERRVRAVLSEFQGPIYQKPPIRASVKRRLRTRIIYYLDCLEVEQRNVLFKVGCQSGTYIRKLCFDIGEALGCGAHMLELRRTRAGPFNENERLATLYDLLNQGENWQKVDDEQPIRKLIYPMEKALALLPQVLVRDSAVSAICHGAYVTAPGVLSVDASIRKNDELVVFTQKGEAVAFAKAAVSAEQILEKDHGLVAETIRVLMDRGTYPKMWRTRAR